jgi:hypothetical protein
MKDAIQFYKNYNPHRGSYCDDDQDEDDEFLSDLTAECYIGFQKLLKTELRIFDRRDSFIMRNSMSMSRR